MAQKPTSGPTDETPDDQRATDAVGADDGAIPSADAEGETAGGAPGGASAAPSSTSASGSSTGAGTGNGWAGTATAGTTGFFGWLRTLGVPRQPGWIGGVAAGLAARLGIDPIIVRGVLVVFALFGAPAFVLYGVAWLLLPDTNGRIHLEQMLRGIFEPALIGVALFLLVGLFPFGGGFLWAAPYLPVPDVVGSLNGWWVGDLLRVLWILALIAGAVAFVIWLVRRAQRTPRTGYGSTPPDAAFAQYESSSADTATTGGQSASTAPTLPLLSDPTLPTLPLIADSTLPTLPLPSEAPTPPPAGATSDAYADWKLRHEAWRVEHEAWRASQAEANRAARAQMAAQNKAKAAEFEAQAAEARRIRQATRPRTSFAFVVTALGAALVGGAVAALVALNDDVLAPWTLAVGLSVATIVTALSMVVAGAVRRRSGFLTFVTIVLLISAAMSAFSPRWSQFVIGSGGTDMQQDASFVIPAGSFQVWADGSLESVDGTPHVRVFQGAGSISVELLDGVAVDIDATVGDGTVQLYRVTADGEMQFERAIDLGPAGSTWSETVGDGSVDAELTIRGGATDITVYTYEESTR